MSDYLIGTDIIGAGPANAVIIRVADPGAVAAGKLKAAGELAFTFLPETTTNQIYSEMVKKIKEALAAEKVVADVQAVNIPSDVKYLKGRSDFLPGIAVGAATVGIGWVLWHFLLRGLILGGK